MRIRLVRSFVKHPIYTFPPLRGRLSFSHSAVLPSPTRLNPHPCSAESIPPTSTQLNLHSCSAEVSLISATNYLSPKRTSYEAWRIFNATHTQMNSSIASSLCLSFCKTDSSSSYFLLQISTINASTLTSIITCHHSFTILDSLKPLGHACDISVDESNPSYTNSLVVASIIPMWGFMKSGVL